MGSGEARGLDPGIQPSRAVDEQDDRDRSKPEHDDQPRQPPPTRTQRCHGKRSGEHCDRDQQVGVRLPRCPRCDGGGCDDPSQPGVAGLADLDTSVGDELGSNQQRGHRHRDRADDSSWS